MTTELREAFPLGKEGLQFLRPHDRVYYRHQSDPNTTPLVEAKYITRTGGRDQQPECTIQLLAPYGPVGIGIAQGEVISAQSNEIFWDETRSFPAERIERFLSESARAIDETVEQMVGPPSADDPTH